MPLKPTTTTAVFVFMTLCATFGAVGQEPKDADKAKLKTLNAPFKRRDLYDVRAAPLIIDVHDKEYYKDPAEPDPTKPMRSRAKDEAKYNLEKQLAARIKAAHPCPNARLRHYMREIKPTERRYQPSPLASWRANVQEVTEQEGSYKVKISVCPQMNHGGTIIRSADQVYYETYVVTQKNVRLISVDLPPISPSPVDNLIITF